MLISDFLNKFVEKLDNLTVYLFITKEQNKAIKETKENLSENQALAILDFADN